MSVKKINRMTRKEASEIKNKLEAANDKGSTYYLQVSDRLHELEHRNIVANLVDSKPVPRKDLLELSDGFVKK